MSAQVDQAHRRAQDRLRTVTAEHLAALIASLPDPTTQEAFDLFTPEAARIVAGGQRQSALFAMAYIARYAPPARGVLPPTPERALADALVGHESPVARSPMLRLRSLLDEGEALDEAQRQAASYAEGLSSGDLQAAERGGLHEAARASGRKIKGWRKVLGPSPCEWCRMIAGTEGSSGQGGRYHSAEAVPFHQRDECGVAPVLEKGE